MTNDAEPLTSITDARGVAVLDLDEDVRCSLFALGRASDHRNSSIGNSGYYRAKNRRTGRIGGCEGYFHSEQLLP